MKYIVTKEIKSETKIIWNIYLQDGAFLLLWVVLMLKTKSNVHPSLGIPYIIFSLIIGIRLIFQSKENPGRRFYQTISIYLQRSLYTYGYFMEEKHEKEHNTTYKRRYTNCRI